MHPLQKIWEKKSLNVIGLMSGTSADGMDAALVNIQGSGPDTKVHLIDYVSLPYPDEARTAILRLASGKSGGSEELCLFHFWLGKMSLDACYAVCEKAGFSMQEIDLVGSHGQTLYHIPQAQQYLGSTVRGTLQLGEASVIAEGLNCPVVSDFRVRDLAAGGQGAPLVPYAEYLLYRRKDASVGLQNIGGIGNITVLPRDGAPEDTFAFDTGPGNMVMDALVFRFSDGQMRYDAKGAWAARGKVQDRLLAFLMEDAYLQKQPPKTTGREMYGEAYVNALLQEAERLSLSKEDILSTVNFFTADTIRLAAEQFCPVKPELLIVGGGGSQNETLLENLRSLLSVPVYTNEDLGWSSDAKEAIAFAVLASECVHGVANNVPSVTGASHPVVMGKISF